MVDRARSRAFLGAPPSLCHEQDDERHDRRDVAHHGSGHGLAVLVARDFHPSAQRPHESHGRLVLGRAQLQGRAPVVVGAYLFVVTGWSKYVKLDLSGFPNVLAFQKRVAARPAVQAAMRAEGLLK